MKVTKPLSELLKFLKTMESCSREFTEKEILKATGWKLATFKTYWNKGQLADFISESSKGFFEASNCLSITEVEFAKLFSQSKHRRGLGHNCSSKLAKALLRKSKDNMLLALELYNRPSLENRMDAFIMCFCTAWEQLLKAIIIEKNGEASIFKAKGKMGLKETISLRDSLKIVYSSESNVRRNIERITFFRDQAVHLLMPEIQGIASRLFQSGVLNYSSKFEEFTEVSFLNNQHSGLISLVGEFEAPPISVMKSTYGDIAEDIYKLASSLEKDVESCDGDIEFAIPLNVKLVFAKEGENGTTHTITRADQGVQGLKNALVIEKPVDLEKTHPFLQKIAINEINKRLLERYNKDKLDSHLVTENKKTGEKLINGNCFLAVVTKNKWKLSDNEFHHKNVNPEFHRYSDRLVEEFIKKIMEHNDYLLNAKKSNNKKS